MSDYRTANTRAGATDWTPLRCLDFITDEHSVRNAAYFDKRDRVAAHIIALTQERDQLRAAIAKAENRDE